MAVSNSIRTAGLNRHPPHPEQEVVRLRALIKDVDHEVMRIENHADVVMDLLAGIGREDTEKALATVQAIVWRASKIGDAIDRGPTDTDSEDESQGEREPSERRAAAQVPDLATRLGDRLAPNAVNFAATPSLYRLDPAAHAMDALDQATARLSQLRAMLSLTFGEGAKHLRELDATRRDNFMWGCATLVDEAVELLTVAFERPVASTAASPE